MLNDNIPFNGQVGQVVFCLLYLTWRFNLYRIVMYISELSVMEVSDIESVFKERFYCNSIQWSEVSDF